MRQGRHIPWFNPRELDDDTLLALNTGRETLLSALFQAVGERLAHPGISRHWLLTGARGAGKSFFLRLAQASFPAAFGQQARFVLLSEEHTNIFAPHEFLAEAQRMLRVDQGDTGAPPAWRVADPAAAWEQALANLLQAFDEPLLVIGVENFDQLLEQAFGEPADNARLRRLMSGEPRLMLVATAVQGDFDEKYDQRLFRQFEHHPIPRWNEEDHRDYLTRRAQREGKEPSLRQLARIDAYSRYTGGNARAAAVLAAAILDERDPLDAASDLDAAIDSMSDYYRALIASIPANTRKLFDALVRGGDPASQTEIADRTGARQNEISRAFAWLVDHSYVRESREHGQKSKQYQVLDRLLVQFYRMRYLAPGQRSKLALMAELLADTIAFPDKWHFAGRYAADGQEPEAQTMMELALKERSVNPHLLPETARTTAMLLALGASWEQRDAIVDIGVNGGSAGDAYQEIVRQNRTDQALRQAIDAAAALARAASRGTVQGRDLVSLLEDSLSVCPIQKYLVLVSLLNPRTIEFQWSELVKTFEGEIEEIQELMSTEGEAIAQLQETLALGRQYPLTVSMQDLSQATVEGKDYAGGLGMAVAADWAACAAIQWLALKHDARASASLDTCFKALDKLWKTECLPDVALEIAARLEPVLSSSTQAQRATAEAFKGVALEHQGRFADAYQAHAAARADQLEAKRPRSAAWNLEKMAWCASALGNIEQAMAHHRQAAEERLAQELPKDFAWNVGQLARHTAGREGGVAAWAFLDGELAKTPDEAISAIQQLGDALYDRARQQGEASAFTLGSEFLQGLAARPQYPAEAALRALWIDMIDMGVPHALLRDLLGEWPRSFGPDYKFLRPLDQLLRDWLDDLDAPEEAREQRRKTLDPDLATTLAALAENLNPGAKRRLNLLPAKPPEQAKPD